MQLLSLVSYLNQDSFMYLLFQFKIESISVLILFSFLQNIREYLNRILDSFVHVHPRNRVNEEINIPNYERIRLLQRLYATRFFLSLT